MPTKPKKGQPQRPSAIQPRDLFQTPDYATDLIARYLPIHWSIWEPCCGQGAMVRRLVERWGFSVYGSDINMGQGFNVLTYTPPGSVHWDCAVTNPPYSIKAKVAYRLLELGKPFALLIPGDWSKWLIDCVRHKGCSLLIPDRRVNYVTPTGKYGLQSAAQFHSVWLTKGIPGPYGRITFDDMPKDC